MSKTAGVFRMAFLRYRDSIKKSLGATISARVFLRVGPVFGSVRSLKIQACTQREFRILESKFFFAGGRVVGFVCFRVAEILCGGCAGASGLQGKFVTVTFPDLCDRGNLSRGVMYV